MSPKLRQLSGRDVARALGTFGFRIVATRGSNAKLRRTLEDGTQQTLTIPLHQALAGGTARAIFRQATRFVHETELRRYFFND